MVQLGLPAQILTTTNFTDEFGEIELAAPPDEKPTFISSDLGRVRSDARVYMAQTSYTIGGTATSFTIIGSARGGDSHASRS